MKLIIAGGRYYEPSKYAYLALDNLYTLYGPITEVVSRGAKGADAIGERWARSRNIPVKVFRADWDLHGLSAGPIRNRQMAKYSEALAAFPGGKGTKNMIKEAELEELIIFRFDRCEFKG